MIEPVFEIIHENFHYKIYENGIVNVSDYKNFKENQLMIVNRLPILLMERSNNDITR